MEVTVKTKDGRNLEVDVVIFCQGKMAQDVNRMFDTNRTETFNVADCVEVEAGGSGELHRLIPGDVLQIRVEFASLAGGSKAEPR